MRIKRGYSIVLVVFILLFSLTAYAAEQSHTWSELKIDPGQIDYSYVSTIPYNRITDDPNAIFSCTDVEDCGVITSVTAGSGLSGGGSSGAVTITSTLGTTIESSEITDGTITSNDIADSTISSSDIADNSVSSNDVNFNYAASSSKGGSASNLECVNCVAFSELDSNICTDLGTSCELSSDTWVKTNGDIEYNEGKVYIDQNLEVNGTVPTIWDGWNISSLPNPKAYITSSDSDTVWVDAYGSSRGLIATAENAPAVTGWIQSDGTGYAGYFYGGSGVYVSNNIEVSGKIGTSGYSPDCPSGSGWGCGVHTFDVWADASVRANQFCIGGGRGSSDPGDCITEWPAGGASCDTQGNCYNVYADNRLTTNYITANYGINANELSATTVGVNTAPDSNWNIKADGTRNGIYSSSSGWSGYFTGNGDGVYISNNLKIGSTDSSVSWSGTSFNLASIPVYVYAPDGKHIGVWANAQGSASAIGGTAQNGFAVYGGISGGSGYSGYFHGGSGLYADYRQGDSIDVAEYIPKSEELEPGDVICADLNKAESTIKCRNKYDTTTLGIVSTEPSYLMGVEDPEKDYDKDNAKLALTGRVPAKVTTMNGPVKIGDLLTTSNKQGYAMKCDDKTKCIGAIVGKALEPLDKGEGKITILVALS